MRNRKAFGEKLLTFFEGNGEDLLAKHKAAVTPMKPKNGADVGHVS